MAQAPGRARGLWCVRGAARHLGLAQQEGQVTQGLGGHGKAIAECSGKPWRIWSRGQPELTQVENRLEGGEGELREAVSGQRSCAEAWKQRRRATERSFCTSPKTEPAGFPDSVGAAQGRGLKGTGFGPEEMDNGLALS